MQTSDRMTGSNPVSPGSSGEVSPFDLSGEMGDTAPGSPIYDIADGSQQDASSSQKWDSNAEMAEQAKHEAEIENRIAELRKEGFWTPRRLSKVPEPGRPKVHWDYLCEEMQWLSADFGQERRWKRGVARKVVRMVVRHHEELKQKEERARREEQAKLRRIATSIAKEVRQFWSNVEKVVQFKQQSRLEEKRKKALDLQLDFIVGQTEKYSDLLSQSLSEALTASKTSSSCIGSSQGGSLGTSPTPSVGPREDEEFLPQEEEDEEEDDEETIEMEERQDGHDAESHRLEIELLKRESEVPLEELLQSLAPEIVQKPVSNHLTKEGEDDDDEFTANEEEAEDEEETIAAEEELEGQQDHAEELSELTREGEMSLEDLLKKYSGPKEEENRGESEESELSGSSDCESSDTDSEGVEFLLKPENGSGTDHLHQDHPEPKKEITDIAATAESLQPKGYTLATTQVKTTVPFLLRGDLREYQHIGLEWMVTMYEKKLNGILADEMGLGKTIQTISLLAHLACDKGNWGPHLIIVPTSVILNWEMELKRWCPSFKILTYYGSQKERKLKRQGWTKVNAFHVCITSYKLVLQDHQAFRRKNWKYLILDEAQNIKNFKSQRWQSLLNFNSQRRLLLTGTPLQNSLMELWSLMHFLMPHVFQSHREFKEWFSNPLTGMIEGSQEYNEGLVRRLHKVLRPFLLRRIKADVEKQMPKKYEHVIYCRLSKRQRFLYDDFMSQAATRDTLASGHFMSVINILMQLRKVCNHPNLFDPRPIHSPFITSAICYRVPSLVLHPLHLHPLQHVDMSRFDLINMEGHVSRYESEVFLPHNKPTRSLIQEIADSPDLPPRPRPLKMKVNRMLQPVAKPDPRTLVVVNNSRTVQRPQDNPSSTSALIMPPVPQVPPPLNSMSGVIGPIQQMAPAQVVAPMIQSLPGPVPVAPLNIGMVKPVSMPAPQPGNITPQRLILSPDMQARLPSGEVITLSQLASLSGRPLQAPAVTKPLTLQLHGAKLTLSGTQVRQLGVGQVRPLQGNVLHLVSSGGQHHLLSQPAQLALIQALAQQTATPAQSVPAALAPCSGQAQLGVQTVSLQSVPHTLLAAANLPAPTAPGQGVVKILVRQAPRETSMSSPRPSLGSPLHLPQNITRPLLRVLPSTLPDNANPRAGTGERSALPVFSTAACAVATSSITLAASPLLMVSSPTLTSRLPAPNPVPSLHNHNVPVNAEGSPAVSGVALRLLASGTSATLQLTNHHSSPPRHSQSPALQSCPAQSPIFTNCSSCPGQIPGFANCSPGQIVTSESKTCAVLQKVSQSDTGSNSQGLSLSTVSNGNGFGQNKAQEHKDSLIPQTLTQPMSSQCASGPSPDHVQFVSNLNPTPASPPALCNSNHAPGIPKLAPSSYNINLVPTLLTNSSPSTVSSYSPVPARFLTSPVSLLTLSPLPSTNSSTAPILYTHANVNTLSSLGASAVSHQTTIPLPTVQTSASLPLLSTSMPLASPVPPLSAMASQAPGRPPSAPAPGPAPPPPPPSGCPAPFALAPGCTPLPSPATPTSAPLPVLAVSSPTTAFGGTVPVTTRTASVPASVGALATHAPSSWQSIQPLLAHAPAPLAAPVSALTSPSSGPVAALAALTPPLDTNLAALGTQVSTPLAVLASPTPLQTMAGSISVPFSLLAASVSETLPSLVLSTQLPLVTTSGTEPVPSFSASAALLPSVAAAASLPLITCSDINALPSVPMLSTSLPPSSSLPVLAAKSTSNVLARGSVPQTSAQASHSSLLSCPSPSSSSVSGSFPATWTAGTSARAITCLPSPSVTISTRLPSAVSSLAHLPMLAASAHLPSVVSPTPASASLPVLSSPEHVTLPLLASPASNLLPSLDFPVSTTQSAPVTPLATTHSLIASPLVCPSSQAPSSVPLSSVPSSSSAPVSTLSFCISSTVSSPLSNFNDSISAPVSDSIPPMASATPTSVPNTHMIGPDPPLSLSVAGPPSVSVTLSSATESDMLLDGDGLRSTHPSMVSGSSRPRRQPPPPPRSPFYLEPLEERRRKHKVERLERIFRLNEQRCGLTPVYGTEVIQFCTLSDKATIAWPNSCPFASNLQDYWLQTNAFKNCIFTPQQRLEQLGPLIERFIFAMPPVEAPPINMHTSHPPPSLLLQESLFKETLSRDLRPHTRCLHRIVSNMRTQFPDLRLIQYDCGKLQTLDRLLRQLKSGGHRVLIFTQMTRMLDILEQFLNYHGHIYLRLDGSTRVEQRQVLMERFNMDKRIFCFILSTRSGGVGVNLTGADTVIFYDSDWNPTMDAQAQDRCHRIGQTRDVHIYRLVSERTVEENILKKAQQKRMLGDMAIEGGNFTTAYFKQQTIRELFDMEDVSRREVETRAASPDQNLDDGTASRDSHILEQALCGAEDEEDTLAASLVRAEQVADLAEFNENAPLEPEEEEQSRAEQEISALVEQLTPIERYAMYFLEASLEDVSREELKQAEEQVEAARKDLFLAKDDVGQCEERWEEECRKIRKARPTPPTRSPGERIAVRMSERLRGGRANEGADIDNPAVPENATLVETATPVEETAIPVQETLQDQQSLEHLTKLPITDLLDRNHSAKPDDYIPVLPAHTISSSAPLATPPQEILEQGELSNQEECDEVTVHVDDEKLPVPKMDTSLSSPSTCASQEEENSAPRTPRRKVTADCEILLSGVGDSSPTAKVLRRLPGRLITVVQDRPLVHRRSRRRQSSTTEKESQSPHTSDHQSPTHGIQSDENSETGSPPPKRKRGRPPKTRTDHSPPGISRDMLPVISSPELGNSPLCTRVPGSSSSCSRFNSESESSSPAEKRKRGRPPKRRESTGTSQFTISSDIRSPSDTTQDNPTLNIITSRLDPKADPEFMTSVALDPIIPSTVSDIPQVGGCAEGASSSGVDDPVTPPKRKRGRPPKSLAMSCPLLHNEKVDSSPERSLSPQITRTPFRRKKKPTKTITQEERRRSSPTPDTDDSSGEEETPIRTPFTRSASTRLQPNQVPLETTPATGSASKPPRGRSLRAVPILEKPSTKRRKAPSVSSPSPPSSPQCSSSERQVTGSRKRHCPPAERILRSSLTANPASNTRSSRPTPQLPISPGSNRGRKAKT